MRICNNQGLLDYLDKNIIVQYKDTNDGHGMDHIYDVINWSLRIAEVLEVKDLNMDIVYASAVYHDIGNIHGKRETHHEDSFDYVLKDEGLICHLSIVEMFLTAMACKEHRASYSGEYTSIYSKIVSDADRCGSIDIDNMIIRAYQYTSSNPDLADSEIFEEVYSHLKDKYGDGGYMSFNLPETENLLGERLEYSRKILSDKKEFRKIYNNLMKKMK